MRLAATIFRENHVWGELLPGFRGKLLRIPYESYVNDQGALLREIAGALALPAGAWTLPPSEGRDNRLPDDVEAARARLLAQVREAAALAAASAGR
jgi:hypothetical protein